MNRLPSLLRGSSQHRLACVALFVVGLLVSFSAALEAAPLPAAHTFSTPSEARHSPRPEAPSTPLLAPAATWYTQSSGTTENLRDVSCTSSTHCAAMGGGGTIVAWNGTAWTSQSSGTTENLRDVSCTSATYCAAVGHGDTILAWDGTTWTAENSGTTAPLLGVSCTTPTHCVAVGSAGTILSTTAAPTALTLASFHGASLPGATFGGAALLLAGAALLRWRR